MPSAGPFCGDPFPGQFDVVGVEVETDSDTSGALGGNHRGSRAEEGIEDDIALEGVQIDETPGQFGGERRRMADTAGLLGEDVPHGHGGFEEGLLRDRIGSGAFTPE